MVVRAWCSLGGLLTDSILQPPPTFQPPPPPSPPSPPGPAGGSTARSSQSRAAKPAEKPEQPDLITRYHLKDQLSAPSPDSEEAGAGSSSGAGGMGAKGWSSNREERQTLLQKRRDQMILEARRKMEAKIAAEKAAAEGK